LVCVIIDGEQLRMVKEVLHLSTAPSTMVCREEEQNVVLGFCKGCVEHEKAGSLYICGCPGTGKSLSMEKVKVNLLNWAIEVFLNLYLIVLCIG
jgi:cell division control protein 6